MALRVPMTELHKVTKAFSSKTRLNIFNLLKNEELSVSRIAKLLQQTEANISAQVKIMEDANLIDCYYEPGEHGVRKMCRVITFNQIILELNDGETL